MADCSRLLSIAARKMSQSQNNLHSIDDNLRLFLSQIESIRHTSRLLIGVDLSFDHLDKLRKSLSRSIDSISPQSQQNNGYFNNNSNYIRSPLSGSDSEHGNRYRFNKSTAASSLMNQRGLGLTYSRKMDQPNGSPVSPVVIKVDNIHRAQKDLESIKNSIAGLHASRSATSTQLTDMIKQIQSSSMKKEKVSLWARTTVDEVSEKLTALRSYSFVDISMSIYFQTDSIIRLLDYLKSEMI